VAIDYRPFRAVTAREVIRALLQDGFHLRRQCGSHQRYQHADGRRVTVSFHKASDTFPLKTLKSIVEDQARWSEEDLRRLMLV
jgi:predicted RNA binding protein YcfA (HicA-like mRNA interferase family)